ncbi:MAG TPA: phosphoadenylyl-sulfate reductase [Chloroflexota bacterium]|nr:phosphoadenylyl-sulfate reductase [Chloroflexota bacterium]
MLFDRPETAELAKVSQRLEAEGPEAALRWTWQEYGPDVSLACSFGGASGMVLVDMVSKLGLDLEVFYLDTGLLFAQTHALREQIEQGYGIRAVAYKPALTVDQQAQKYGSALWERDPDQCCAMRKLEPNREALAGKRAWITGIRRDQTANRGAAQVVEWDERFGLIKVNPVVGWTEDQVWDYIQQHDVPYHPLLEQGYSSIGCLPCTRAVAPGEDARAGRWSGFMKTECGLHLPARKPVLPQISQQGSTEV